MEFKPRRSLGQNFLISYAVAAAEAAHAEGKTVLEIGPGRGILTAELVKTANRVIAVEKDHRLYNFVDSKIITPKLKLIHADFFDLTDEDIELDKIDMLIANIPYNLSSKVVFWLLEKNLDAVLCLQKEFVQHMLAPADTEHYSRLSVMCALCFKIVEIKNVSRKYFRPMPKVDSEVILIKPKPNRVTKEEAEIINLLMQHKKKTLKNALLDSKRALGLSKEKLVEFAASLNSDERVFKIEPELMLGIATSIVKLQNP